LTQLSWTSEGTDTLPSAAFIRAMINDALHFSNSNQWFSFFALSPSLGLGPAMRWGLLLLECLKTAKLRVQWRSTKIKIMISLGLRMRDWN
jgi:hypothetical protein